MTSFQNVLFIVYLLFFLFVFFFVFFVCLFVCFIRFRNQKVLSAVVALCMGDILYRTCFKVSFLPILTLSLPIELL